jgi:hypothetical protein
LGAFDKNNSKHIEILNKWKSKNTKYYNNAINTWTKLDVKKLKAFKENNLNFKIFYNISQFNNWYNKI